MILSQRRSAGAGSCRRNAERPAWCGELPRAVGSLSSCGLSAASWRVKEKQVTVPGVPASSHEILLSRADYCRRAANGRFHPRQSSIGISRAQNRVSSRLWCCLRSAGYRGRWLAFSAAKLKLWLWSAPSAVFSVCVVMFLFRS